MSQTILFTWAEAPDCVYSMFVADEASTATLIHRMEALGYTIADVSPLRAGRPPMRAIPGTRADLQIRSL